MSTTLEAVERLAHGDWSCNGQPLSFTELRDQGLLVQDATYPSLWTCPKTGGSYSVAIVQQSEQQARYLLRREARMARAKA